MGHGVSGALTAGEGGIPDSNNAVAVPSTFPNQPMTTLTLHIDGMTCGHCVAAVTRALTAVNGVTVDTVTLGTATVHFDPTATTPTTITNAVQDEGYAVASTS